MNSPRSTGRLGLLLLAAGLLLLASCPNPLQRADLRGAIEDEVDIATARTFELTIESSDYAVLSPSGTVEAKEGFPVTLGATPFPTHALIGWTQTGGAGTVAFAQEAGAVTATVRGGDATVAPLLVEKPKVLYTMPIGNNIARNSNIAVAFSTEIDFDTIDQASFQVLKSGIEQVDDGEYFISADGKTIGFNPAGDLAVYSNYVISIGAQVLGVLDLEAYQQGNTLLIDDPLQIAGSYTAAFRTGVDLDNIPPVNGDFTVSGYSGDPYYTNNPRVTLSDINAEDDAGVALVLVKNPADADYLSFSFQNNPTITWSVPFTNGRKDIWMVFEDWNNQRTPDLSKVVRTIAVDSTAPTGTVSVNGYSGGVPDFIDSTAVTLTLSASDADVEAGVKGSGESTNGTDTVNRKQMRFANSSGGLASASWEAYAASRAGWSLGAATEGSRTVFAQFRDAVGNESPIYSDGIYLDVTAPTGSFTLAGGGLYTNATTITLAVTASDGGSGVNTLKVNNSPGLQPSSPYSVGGVPAGSLDANGASAAFPFNAQLGLTLTAVEGAHLINLEVADKVGRPYTFSQTLTRDVTLPTGGLVTINGGVAKTNSTAVTLQITPATDNPGGSGVTHMGFSNTAGLPATWLPVATSAPWTLAGTEGDNTVSAWFRDAAGNVTASPASDIIELDTTPPDGSITVTPNPSSSNLVTVNSTINGATFMRFSNNNSLWSTWQAYVATRSNWDLTSATYGGSGTNGSRTVYAQYCDGATGGAGLITPKSASLTFDNTAPSATLSIASGAATTTSSTVTLTISASDNVYGAASLLMQFSNNGTTWSAWETYSTTKSGWSLTSGYGGTTTQETKTVYLRVKDPLGNGATTNRTDTIVYDYTKPVAVSPSINAGATYNNVSTVTFTLSASDNVYGAASLQMRFSNNNSTWSAWEAYSTTKSGWSLTTGAGGSTAEGTRTVYAQVSDPAGNISTTISDSIVYDITPPSGSFSIESGNPATSVYTAAILYFSMTDNLSGVVERRLYDNYNGTWLSWEAYSASKSWYLTPGNGTKYVYVYFRDGAGNSTAGYLNDSVTLAETYGSLSRNDIVHYGDDYMSTAAISGSDDFAASPLKPGTVLVYKTSGGLIGRLEVTGFNKTEIITFPTVSLNVLTVNLVNYNASGSVVLTRSGLKIRGTYGCDLDTGTEVSSSSGADFQWRQDTSTVRYLVPGNGAKFFKWK